MDNKIRKGVSMGFDGFPVPVSDTIVEYIQMQKVVESGKLRYNEPRQGEKLEVGLISTEDKYLKFVFSVFEARRRSSVSIDLTAERKTTLQTRKDSIPLVRIDLDPNGEHTNPNGQKIKGSHLHIACEGHGHRWAVPLSDQTIIEGIKTYDMPSEVFEPFKRFCGIEEGLMITWTLGCEV